MFPATRLMSLMGTNQIHELRHDLAQRAGFNLQQFHDRLLQRGSVSVALTVETMRQEAIIQ